LRAFVYRLGKALLRFGNVRRTGEAVGEPPAGRSQRDVEGDNLVNEFDSRNAEQRRRRAWP
jgi:hypothetical protein